ncbi:hypothetical protein RJI07_05995 [Mycoplasmatota bacterium WC30]
MNKSKIKTKYIESAFLGYGLTFFVVLGYSVIALIYFVVPESMADETLSTEIIFIVMFGGSPTLLWIFMIHRGFSVIEINQNHIKKSLFRVFHKRIIYWNEIKEIIVINRVTNWIFFGKFEMKNIKYDKLVTHKDIIHIQLSKDVLEAVRMYYKQEIIGLDTSVTDK